MSVNIHYNDLYKTIEHLAERHKGDIASLYLTYEIEKLYHPRYDTKYDQVLPLIVIDWK